MPDTVALQRAIDDCAGNRVFRLDGKAKFVSGPLILRSHTILEIPAGITLEASQNHLNYQQMEMFRKQGRQPLFLAKNANHITIRGGGVIDGCGQSWWPMHRSNADARPRLIVFDHCSNILMEGITVQNSPSWQIVPYYSEDLIFRNMTILAPAREGHNTDGINPFSSKRILIANVTIDTGDDNIAIKSGQPGSFGPDSPSEDIRIVDCTFRHGHGLSIGSELAGGVRNVSAERILFDGTDQGVRIKCGRDRGNEIRDLVFRELSMKNVGTAIMITDYYGAPRGLHGGNATVASLTQLTPRISDIVFEKVRVGGAQTGMLVDGLPEAPIESVLLKDASINANRVGIIRHGTVRLQNVVYGSQRKDPIELGPGAVLLAQ